MNDELNKKITTLTISRECPECERGVIINTKSNLLGKMCSSCTSGKQTRPLNMVEDVTFHTAKTVENYIRFIELKQSLIDAGWSINDGIEKEEV